MPPLDLPRPPRSLDDPLGGTGRPAERTDGHRARPPGELLDQLRERLGRLADNHPSASPGMADRRAPEQTEDDDRPDVDGYRSGAEPSRYVTGQDRSAAVDRSTDEQNGSVPGLDVPQTPRTTATGGRDTVLGVDGPASGEPYLPWFMSAERGVPWFAGGS